MSSLKFTPDLFKAKFEWKQKNSKMTLDGICHSAAARAQEIYDEFEKAKEPPIQYVINRGYPCRICMHGVAEALDWHRCSGCERLANKMGYPPQSEGYIFFKEPTAEEIKKSRKEHGADK